MGGQYVVWRVLPIASARSAIGNRSGYIIRFPYNAAGVAPNRCALRGRTNALDFARMAEKTMSLRSTP
jgi:hypothetical protein